VAQPKYSSPTKSVIDRIRSKKKEEAKAMNVDLNVSMRAKHQDLLAVQRKIVVPNKYRALLEMGRLIDCTLNFLKTRKDKSENYIMFRDIQQSIASSQAKTLTLNMFKQILFLCPDLYEHKWQIKTLVSQKEPVLVICFKSDPPQKSFLNQEEINRRQDLVRKSIINHTTEIHKSFLDELSKT
jgi:hypothetical protein